MSVSLQYKTQFDCAAPDELLVGECCIRKAINLSGMTWWMLWFAFARTDDGALDIASVPINVGGVATDSTPTGRAWGFKKKREAGVWAVSPSVNVLDAPRGLLVHPGKHPALSSIWHETPDVVGVPAGEPWQ